MQIETDTRMKALQIKVRAEIGARTLMEGNYPNDLTPAEQVVAQRLAELWKQDEPAEVSIEWRLEGDKKVVYVMAIKRADGTLEKYDGHDGQEGNPVSENTSTDKPDYVNHPPHYATHPSGVECVDIAEHLSFNLGNALKYLWRAKMKDEHIENLEKCLWYLEREARLTRLTGQIQFGLDSTIRLNAQKFLDKEGKTSAVGKFVERLTAPMIDHEDFAEFQKIVRAELKIVKNGDSR